MKVHTCKYLNIIYNSYIKQLFTSTQSTLKSDNIVAIINTHKKNYLHKPKHCKSSSQITDTNILILNMKVLKSTKQTNTH